MNRSGRRAALATARRRNLRAWEDRSLVIRNAGALIPEFGEFLWAKLNDLYSVQAYEPRTGWVHLLIRRHDGKPDIPWSDKQRIKNELVGAHRHAFEQFPAEDELVNQAHMYHLWVMPDGERPVVGLPRQVTL